LPQLKVLGSVMRTEKLGVGPECSASGRGFGYRKRLDGGYNISQMGGNVYDIVPDSLCLLRKFLPLARLKWKDIRFRVGQRWVAEWQTPRRWSPDEISPFERVRMLDPEPVQGCSTRRR
jgi:hypothetical protein